MHVGSASLGKASEASTGRSSAHSGQNAPSAPTDRSAPSGHSRGSGRRR